MDLFLKKDLNKEEYLLMQTLCIFQMKKIAGEKIQKILTSDDTK